jgi:hypothetical protein
MCRHEKFCGLSTRQKNVLQVFVLLRLGYTPWLRNTTHTRKISFSGLVIQITIVCCICNSVGLIITRKIRFKHNYKSHAVNEEKANINVNE